MRKVKLVILIIVIGGLALFNLTGFTTNKNVEKSMLREEIYNFLQVKENREEAFADAIDLNNGSSENTCVYFVSEVLRKSGYYIPKETGNTTQIISILEKEGWKKDYDFKKLRPGDICFTTDYTGNKKGRPSHTYVFMGWVEEGSYDYAYICDNQAKDYENEIYHIRNVKNRVIMDCITKDAFSFFMKSI